MSSYKTHLSNYGFTWDDKLELWIKKKGFGQKITIEKMFSNLFTMRHADSGYGTGKVIYDGFVKSEKEFIKILEDYA